MAKLIKHPIFSEKEHDSDEFKNYVNSDQFTPDEYIKYNANKFDKPHNFDEYDFTDHKHNNPENNKKVLSSLLNQVDKASKEAGDDSFSRKYNGHTEMTKLEKFLENTNLDSDTLKKYVNRRKKILSDGNGAWKEDYDHGDFKKLLKNPNLKKEVLDHIAEKEPKLKAKIMSHPLADHSTYSKLGDLKHEDIADTKDIEPLNEKGLLHNDLKKELVKKTPMGQQTMEYLLGSMPEHDRDDTIDSLLGIKGGHHKDEFDPDEELDVDERQNAKQNWDDGENWDNWTNGPEYKKGKVNDLAESSFLKDHHADHIKRHGDLESKWNLFNNPDVDSKHAIQMHQKWSDDDSHHGYDKDELKNHYQEQNGDSLREEFDDEARNEANEDYSMSDWMNDNDSDVREHILENDSDDIHDKLNSDYEWNTENPDHDKKLHAKFQALPEQDTYTKADFLKAGFKENEISNFDSAFDDEDEESTIDRSDVEAKMDKNPPEIDYANHYYYSIHDHPDYSDREDEVIDKIRDEYADGTKDTPDSWYNSHDESNRESMYEIQDRMVRDKLDNMLEDDDIMPDHLYGGIHGGKSNQIEYGDGQHHLEMLKDYADQNGGKIDIGQAIKLHPNLKEQWQKQFNKPRLTSDELQKKIEELPKKKYNVSYGQWGKNKMQNLNDRNQTVVRLDRSPEEIKEIQKDPALYNTFQKLQQASRRSGHPTNKRTIGWARVDQNDPKHWMLDEQQTDWSSAARRYLDANNAPDKAAHIQKIMDMDKNWREVLLNHIIKMAKTQGAEKISTHSPESKAKHTGAGNEHSVYFDSYQKNPRKMGFKPNADIESLPLTESGKKAFVSNEAVDTSKAQDLADEHTSAANHHFRKAFLAHHMGLPELSNQHYQLAEKHNTRIGEISDKYKGWVGEKVDPNDFDQKSLNETAQGFQKEGYGFEPDKADESLNKPIPEPQMPKPITAHTLDLTPQKLIKNLELADLLMKSEAVIWAMKEQNLNLNIDGLLEKVSKIEALLYNGNSES